MRRNRAPAGRVFTAPAPQAVDVGAEAALPPATPRPRDPIDPLYDDDLERAIIGGAILEDGGLDVVEAETEPIWFSDSSCRKARLAIPKAKLWYNKADGITLGMALIAEHGAAWVDTGDPRLWIVDVITRAPELPGLRVWIQALKRLRLLREAREIAIMIGDRARGLPLNAPDIDAWALMLHEKLRAFVGSNECNVSASSAGSTLSTAQAPQTPIQ